ncbi:MAG: cobalamin-independent methionine synthase II family protein [Pseudonocardiales bacterium]|nr:cobalamin-independent methionine synthase II family protein [Pseudonocardiales bacterium]
MDAMSTQRKRIFTTHTGSLPRPGTLTQPAQDGDAGAAPLRSTVAETVSAQIKSGLDVINDGEMSKPSYVSYVTQRLAGFGGPPAPRRRRNVEDFPEYAARQFGDPALARILEPPSCDGPVSYLGHELLARDIENLRVAVADHPVVEVFMTAASPGVIEMFMPNHYYHRNEDYLLALADAMKEEYDAIAAAGFLVQLDCPDLAAGWENQPPGTTLAEFRRQVATRLELIDYATRDIPPERLRMHLCWGNYEGPHHHDLPLANIIDLVLRARPAALCLEAANPRHEHEWAVFKDVPLPEGKVLIPGVLDTTTNYIEHPELVAQRITRFAEVVGRQRVIAGSDCGFATFAARPLIDPRIAWAKLATLAEGARLASEMLWPSAKIEFP